MKIMTIGKTNINSKKRNHLKQADDENGMEWWF